MKKFTWILAIVSLLIALLALPAAAQGTPTIGWWAIGGGGGSATAGSVSLNSTLGQWAIGSSANGTIQLLVGFWGGPST